MWIVVCVCVLEFQAEKPDIMLSVICGSLHVADRMILGSFQNFQSTLERYGILILYDNTLTSAIISCLSFLAVNDSEWILGCVNLFGDAWPRRYDSAIRCRKCPFLNILLQQIAESCLLANASLSKSASLPVPQNCGTLYRPHFGIQHSHWHHSVAG